MEVAGVWKGAKWFENTKTGRAGLVLAAGRIYWLYTSNRGRKIGLLRCLTRKEGRLLWEQPIPPQNEPMNNSPVWVDGKLLVVNGSGTLYILRDLDSKGEVLHEQKICGPTTASPAVTNGRLFIHDRKFLYCYALKQER